MIPPIVCISLADATQRRVFMTEQLEKLGLPYRFLDAIRPDLSQGWPACYQRKKRLAQHGHDLTQGEIGCFLSHRQAWQEFLASADPFCCVLEDDVQLQPGFVEGMAALCECAKDWDIVRLYGVFRRESVNLCELTPGRWMVDYFDQPRGTQGYVLNRAAAQRLLQHTDKMACAIDDAIDRGWEHKLRLYGVEPYLVVEQLQHVSTIGSRKRPRLPLLRRLLREINRGFTDLRKQRWVMEKRIRYAVLRRTRPPFFR